MTPTVAELAKNLADTQTALNIVWTMVAGFLVMFMQAGFALVETGLTRAKNVAHTMGMNFLVYAIGIIGFYFVGFGLQMGGVGALATFGGDATSRRSSSSTSFGKDFGLFGMTGFMLPARAVHAAVAAMFLFQMVLHGHDRAPSRPAPRAERWKFSSFVIFSFVISMLIYPVYANWVWGGGWLSQLGTNFGLGHGHVDFAGSLGRAPHRRRHRARARQDDRRRASASTRADGRVNPIPPHNIPQVMIGTFILAFGWFGFNAGSTLAGMDTRLAIVAVNTMFAGATGAFSAYLYVKARWGKADPSWLANGMLAGLVAITAPVRVRLVLGGRPHRRHRGRARHRRRRLHRHEAQDRRPGRRVGGPRRERRVGHPRRSASSRTAPTARG